MRGPLPVYVEDPIARLQVVKRAMDGLKESKQAVGAEVLASLEAFAPPTILAQASRLNFSTRLFNLLVTNVPGPQVPLYLLGRELQDFFPVAFLPEDHALAVAIMSYNGNMDFGLLADYDAMPDLDGLGGAPRRRPRGARGGRQAQAAPLVGVGQAGQAARQAGGRHRGRRRRRWRRRRARAPQRQRRYCRITRSLTSALAGRRSRFPARSTATDQSL